MGWLLWFFPAGGATTSSLCCAGCRGWQAEEEAVPRACQLPSSSCSPSREIPGDSAPVHGVVGPGSSVPGVGAEGRAVPQSQLLAQRILLHKIQHWSNPSRKS